MENSKRAGFTLIELLTVIAIIGVLAAILVPVVGKVRESAAETAGRTQFSQWAQAFELFRQDYGHYPQFKNEEPIEINKSDNAKIFYESLTGRKSNGTNDRIESGDEGYKAGNVRAASYYTFAEGEVEMSGGAVRIIDHFGNSDIVVLFDRNQDGVIRLTGTDADHQGALPAVVSARTGKSFQAEITAAFPTDGVRSNIIFYSAGFGNRPLMSWK